MSFDLKKRIVSGWAWSIGCRIFGMTAAFLTYALLARKLSPAELGGYFLIMSIVGFLSTIVLFGLPAVAVRLIAASSSESNKGKTRKIISKSMIIVISNGLLVAVLLNTDTFVNIFTSVLNSEGIGKHGTLMGLIIISTSLLTLLAGYFRGFHDMRLSSVFSGASFSILTLILLYSFDLLNLLGIYYVLLATLLASLITLIIAVLFFHSYWKAQSHGHFSLQSKKLLKLSGPIAAINMAAFLSLQGVLWMVSYHMTEQDVALYGSVLRIIALLTMTHALLIGASQSSMAQLYAEGDIKRLQKLGRTIATITTITGIFASLVFLISGNQILNLVFGEFYEAGSELLIYITGFYVIGIFFGPTGMLLMMAGHVKPLFWNTVGAIFFRFLAAYILAAPYGMIGIAVAWGLGGWLQNIIGWLLVKKHLNIYSHFDPTVIMFKKRH